MDDEALDARDQKDTAKRRLALTFCWEDWRHTVELWSPPPWQRLHVFNAETTLVRYVSFRLCVAKRIKLS